MKGSHLAAAGGVFVAVLVVCFAFIGFGTKGEATAKPDPIPVLAGPPNREEPAPDAVPQLPTPKPPAVALGGFAAVARLERGYDGTASLTASSSSAIGRIATWRLPAEDVAAFGDTSREVRLTADRLVGVGDTGVRVFDARSGEPIKFVTSGAKGVSETALSPHGDWAVQATGTGVTLTDLSGGLPVKVATSAKRTLTGPVGSGADNDWCAVLGEDDGKPAVFRLRKDGAVEVLGQLRSDTTRGQSSHISRLYASSTGGRMVIERPTEKSPTPRFLVWSPLAPAPVPLPVFSGERHDWVRRFHLSRDGTRALLFNEARVKVVDLDTGRVLLTHEPDGFTIGDAAFGPDGGRVVVAYGSHRQKGELGKTPLPGHAVVFDVATKAPVGRRLSFDGLGVRQAGVRRCVLSADGSRLAVVEVGGTVHLLDTDRAFGDGTLKEKGARPDSPVPGRESAPKSMTPTTVESDT